ncbi:MAG: hypothetical protein DU481_05935 [Nitrosomonas sp.]|uniref:hypothetical protein n=1 Tax=Nitrosomonas sp. TaxID=42353 RepID=UPI0032EC7BFD
MKPCYSLIIAALIMLSACDQNKADSSAIKDNVDDILDQRPGEKVRDAVEDVSDKVKGAGKEIKETIKDATN